MRLIGSLAPSLAERFSLFLKREGVSFQCEFTLEGQKEVALFWITHEEDKERAEAWLLEYQKDPQATRFDSAPQQLTKASPLLKQPFVSRKRVTPLTYLVMAAAILLFLFAESTAPKLPEDFGPLPILYTAPIIKELLFDYPHFYELADEVYVQGKKDLLPTLEKSTYWQGLYREWLDGLLPYKGPMFEKIREGEWWRLFTPCLLHGNFLHIFFNLMWIALLSFQMERKVGSLKLLFFILITGIGSNTAEYLMTGPNFLGLSGVVCAMAGFIWMRQRRAPWEGYVLHSSTILFIALFVGAMLILQIISFFAELFWHYSFPLQIANTAHISGGLLGILLGMTSLASIKRN